MFVLHSLFSGAIDGYIDFFSQKTQMYSDRLPQFVAPLISIMRNLYAAVNDFGNKENDKYDNLVDIFRKTDSFEMVYFEKLRDLIMKDLPP